MTDDPRIRAASDALGRAGYRPPDDALKEALTAADAVDPLRRPPAPASRTAAHAMRSGPRNWTLYEPNPNRVHWSDPSYGEPDD